MRMGILVVALVACRVSEPAPEGGVPDVIEDTGEVGNVDDTDASVDTDPGPVDPDCLSDAGASMERVLTPHFRAWLAAQPAFDVSLAREDLDGGAFGGRISDGDCAAREPVVFVHGNGDRAIGGAFGGWGVVRSAFLDAGYRSAELYATTYGPADPLQASQYAHDRQSVLQVRRFLEAVLAYTGSSRIDVVSHSLGVTVARRAILGGTARDRDGTSYEIGPPLTDRVDTFVGIAGGNLGLASCALSSWLPVCGTTLGLYPGWSDGRNVHDVAEVLRVVNRIPGFEGEHRFSLWSDADDVVGGACLVWGRNTCRVPGQTGERRYRLDDHFDVRDRHGDVIVGLVAAHR